MVEVNHEEQANQAQVADQDPGLGRRAAEIELPIVRGPLSAPDQRLQVCMRRLAKRIFLFSRTHCFVS